MLKKLLLVASLLANLTWAIPYAEAQNTTCANRPDGDSTNACANTRFVMTNGGGGGGTPGGSNLQVQYNNNGAFGGYNNIQLTALIQSFTSILSGAVPASGGGIENFLRADGSWVPPGGGSAIVGTILPWTGASVPTSYLLAYGQAVSRTTYSDLMLIVTFQQSIACTSASPTFTVTADIAQRATIGATIEAAGCFNTGATILSKTGSTLTLSSNAIATISTNLIIYPWGAGDGSTTFNVPNLQGRTLVGRDNMSGTAAGVLTTSIYGSNPDALGALGGAQSKTLIQANLPAASLTTSISDPGHTHSINTVSVAGTFNNNGGGGGAFSAMSSAAASVGAATTGITASTALGGSSTPFSVVQPSVTIDWIIKALPDTNINNDTLTVGGTIIANGANTNILYNNNGILGEYALAALADMYAGTAANKVVTPSVIWPPEVTVTYGTTTTFNMATFRDAVVTLTGNITTMTVSGVVVGKAGSIAFIQDGSGNHTTVWDSKFKFTGGITPTLTATAGAVDILSYSCRTATFCFAAMMNDVK